MKNIKYSIHFYSPWHCGSGLSAGADADSLVIKDKYGMPFIPGKTLKGLVREAVEDYAALSESLSEKVLNEAFGLPANADKADDNISGSAFFTNAKLDDKETAAIVGNKAQRYLFNNVSSTAIGEDGIAVDHSLRSIETVVPCTLYAEIYDLSDEVANIVEKSFGLIHHIGLNRSRGTWTLRLQDRERRRTMKTLKFKCTLLSDIVLNTSAATEGEQTSLDFIPGNNFLGIVALDYDSLSKPEQMEIFHSGKVRFGDAHPSDNNAKVRSLHVPATLFYPKGKYAWEECYAFQSYSRKEDIRTNGKPMQLKQCRSGYCVFQNATGSPVTVAKSFAIKSSYDRDNRRAKDGLMFGYESLDQGQTFLFDVEVDNEALADKISKALEGIHHIGRSRTAQYGLVRIEAADYKDVQSRQEQIDTIDGKRVAVYADSRLIFLDDAGQPVFQPTSEQLGLDGKIDWDISQIRTFQYAPWNGKRQTRDADRCGIEKGRVFFVKCNSVPVASRYVGSYNHEGFGKIIYNPGFLCSKGENGKAMYQLLKSDTAKTTTSTQPLGGSPLLDYVATSKKDFETEGNITEKVNDFVSDYGRLFKGASFASQWGRIRKIAITHPTKKGIIDELYEKTEMRHHFPSPNDDKEYDKPENVGYLVHGVAKSKWAKNGRKDKLRAFIDSVEADYVQQAVVNLALEMAKICTRNGKN